jgi:hypothetical protein
MMRKRKRENQSVGVTQIHTYLIPSYLENSDLRLRSQSNHALVLVSGNSWPAQEGPAPSPQGIPLLTATAGERLGGNAPRLDLVRVPPAEFR